MSVTKTFNTPSKLKERNTKHLNRKCEVFIFKKAHLWSERVSTVTERDDFEQKYNEFIGGKYPIISDYNKLLDRYVIFASGDDPKSGESKLSGIISNTDVISVSTTLSTTGTSVAEIRLKNASQKYQFKKHPLYAKQCIIQSNDEIIINLSGLDNELYQVFKGYINTVSLEDDGLDHTIQLSCEDTTKKLRESRTNVKPSLNIREAEIPIVVFSIPWTLEKPHEILSQLIVRHYSNFDSISGFTTKLSNYETSNQPEQINQLYKDNVDKFIVKKNLSSVTAGVGGIVSLGESSVSTPETLPERIYIYKTSRVTSDMNTRMRQMGLNPSNNDHQKKFDALDLIAIINGTSQEAYKIEFITSNWNFWLSEWQAPIEICRNVSRTLFFEFFMDPSGVIRSRPVNISLPADVPYGTVSTKKDNDGTISSDVFSSQQPRVGSEYWIEDIYIINDNVIETDNGIFSIVVTRGDFRGPIKTPDWNVATYKDEYMQRKYGPRMANQLHRVDLKSPDACEVWGKAWLQRNNKKASSGSITMLGDARLQPGNPCHVEKNNMIYYIEKISHMFTPGDRYTMTLTLTLGRHPFALTQKGYDRLITSGQNTAEELLKYPALLFDRVLAERGPNGSSELSKVDVLRYQKYKQELTFGNYIWENISDLDYKKLLEEEKEFKEVINEKVKGEMDSQTIAKNNLRTGSSSYAKIRT